MGRRKRTETLDAPLKGPLTTPLQGPLATPALLLRLGLIDAAPDADGLYNGCVLPPGPSAYLWRLSWLSLASAVAAVLGGHVDLVFVPLGVWLTSILYWQRPNYSWRRYLDIAYVQFALWFQVYRAANAQHRVPYYALTFAGVPFFLLGTYLSASPWSSALCHGMIHILANAGNVYLYSGTIAPQSH